MPHHLHSFEYLFVGLEGKGGLVPWMRISGFLTVCTVALLIFPKVRRNEGLLAGICVAVIAAIWIEKGMGLVVTGFIPSPLGQITEYVPTGPEAMVAAGVYGLGFLVLTLLYKIVVNVRERTEQTPAPADH